MKYTLTFTLFIVVNCLFGQSLSESLKKANDVTSQLKKFSYEVNYISFSRSGVIAESKMKVEKVDEVIYTRMDQIDSYVLDSTSVLIDHSDKVVLLNIGVKNLTVNQNITKQLEMVKELERKAEKVSSQIRGDIIEYTLVFTENEFKQVLLTFEKSTGFFKSMKLDNRDPIYNYKDTEEEPAVSYEITIKNYNTNLSKLSKPISEILDLKEGRYFLKPKYSTYQFDNNYDWY